MGKVKVTITLDESVMGLVKSKHRNTSQYINELVKADIFREREQSIYDGIVKRLLNDGYISNGGREATQPITISGYRATAPTGSGQPCCAKATPCKHWTWDTVSGEGYINSLTGELRSA